MRTVSKRLAAFPLLVLAGMLLSCQNELLPVPTGTKVQTSRSIAPEHLVASQGRVKIHLSWSPVQGAQRYCLYASDQLTPTEESFSLITYVSPSDSPSCEIDVRAGSESWYRVSAILSSGKETVAGSAVLATSLATPEITAIETDASDASALTVFWNMSNCRNDTYRRQTEYEITCTNTQDASDSVRYSVKAADLTNTEYTVTGLQAHSSYKVKITARTEMGDEAESAELRAETLHQLQPAAPVRLEASYGTSKDGITLTFELPEQADLQIKDDASYVKSPVYFKVYRRESAQSAWSTISERADITDAEGTQITSGNYPDNGGIAVRWTDTTVPVRGVFYEYKVQSYIDLDYFKARYSLTDAALKSQYNYVETSSAASYAAAKGWALAKGSLYTRDFEAHESEDGATYESATVGLSFAWKNFLLDSSLSNKALSDQYAFFLYESFVPFDCDSAAKAASTTFLSSLPTADDVNAYTRTFSPAGDRGTYTYHIYIVPSGAEIPASSALPDSYYDVVTVTTPLTVTDNAGSIEDFTVTGGYKDKFVISWKAEGGMQYVLTYSETQDGNPTASDVAVDLSGYTLSGTVSIDDTSVPSVACGVRRTYRLTATASGAASTAPISNTSESCGSLGLPVPLFDISTIQYDTVTVSWQEVQEASSYAVRLEGNAEVQVVTEGEDKNVEVTKDISGVTRYAYTFTPEQLGEAYYRTAGASGMPLAVDVRAASPVDSTEAIVQAKTLGPATVSLDATVAAAYKSITVTWNKVDGASAYILLRKRFKSDGNGGWQSDEDEYETFAVSAESLAVSANGETYSAMTATESGGTITLVDSHADIPETDKASASQTAITQSRIPWGIPVEYLVVPVLSEKDSFNGTTLSSSFLHSDDKKLSYEGIASFARWGSAVGYGLEVTAAKADSSEYVRIEWQKPYTGSASVNPLIYRRLAGQTGAYSEDDILGSSRGSSASTTAFAQVCTTDSERKNPYEYAVKYIANSAADSDISSEQKAPFVTSYTDSLAGEADYNGEPRAVGYLFYLPAFTVNNVQNAGDTSEGFTESVSWSTWDSTRRRNGPEDNGDVPAYTVWAKNKNNASGWFQIASMTAGGKVTVTEDPGWYGAAIEPSGTGVTLTPRTESGAALTDGEGVSNGLLKVQRDYRHYYMIRAQRTNSEGKVVYTYIGLDESVWTYRRITAEEFTKCVLLIMADAVNQAGITEGDRTTTGYNGKGTYKTNRYGANTGFMYGTENTNYMHCFYGLPGKPYDTNISKDDNVFASAFTIKSPMTERLYGVIMYAPYYFPESTTLVTHETEAKSYQGKLVFTAGEKLGMWTVSSGKTYSLSASVTVETNVSKTFSVTKNQTAFEAIFPIKLGESYHDKVFYRDEDSSRAQYNNNWWLVLEGGTESASFVTEAE